MLPLCSVIIPVYNSKKFIEKTIESVLTQTFDNFEVIIIDDCSTDGSMEIIKDMSKKDPRIRFYQNAENQGVAQTRNIGLELARGKYIALLDSDDIWLPEKLELQITFMQEKEGRLSHCSYGFIDKEHNILSGLFSVPPSIDLKGLLKRNVISCSTVIAERQLFLRHRFKSEYYHEDFVLWIDMLKECKLSYGYVGELAKIRIMRGSRSSNKLHSAKQRWLIYRKHMQMGLLQSTYYYSWYMLLSVIKYRILRKAFNKGD